MMELYLLNFTLAVCLHVSCKNIYIIYYKLLQDEIAPTTC